MKKRLHDKKAGIVFLAALIIISLADIISRVAILGEAVYSARNLGEQLAVVVLAATILILGAKGKDRICYICYSAWIGCFVLNQLFELPGMIVTLIRTIASKGYGIGALIFTIIASLGFIAIGVLLVEYMNDGTIYNSAFNIICTVTALSILAAMIMNIIGITTGNPDSVILIIFYNLYRLAMVFMCTFFAYDSAKHQLKKANLSK
jgi:hypothetical protein